jgi:hypothetical protein
MKESFCEAMPSSRKPLFSLQAVLRSEAFFSFRGIDGIRNKGKVTSDCIDRLVISIAIASCASSLCIFKCMDDSPWFIQFDYNVEYPVQTPECNFLPNHHDETSRCVARLSR